MACRHVITQLMKKLWPIGLHIDCDVGCYFTNLFVKDRLKDIGNMLNLLPTVALNH